MPNLQSLRARSAYTTSASSVMPSMTLPCHTSIFYSVPPARHGVTSNVWSPMARPLPGLVEVVKSAGLKAASIYNWEQLRDLNRPGSMYYSYFCDNCYSPDGDDRLVDEAIRFFGNGGADFVFFYFGTVDVAGHNFGWLSPQYIGQAERVDAALGRLLATLPENFSIVLQSDHGGHDRNHGTDCPEDMTIPWMVSGRGVARNYEITTPVSLLSTAPTIAHLMGIPKPVEWEGTAVTEIFEM